MRRCTTLFMAPSRLAKRRTDVAFPVGGGKARELLLRLSTGFSHKAQETP